MALVFHQIAIPLKIYAECSIGCDGDVSAIFHKSSR